MKVLLLGLGRANLGVAQYLLKRGDEVHLYEENVKTLAKPAKDLIDTGKVIMYRENSYDLVITSPGFPPHKEIIRKLSEQHMPIIDEIEFTYEQLKNPKIIAVTGTNGKSTTAALISSILTTAGIRNFLGGNIAPGIPFSQILLNAPLDFYVLEISSFQLMRIKKFHPVIALITNIATDHLNWHRDFAEYKAAKARIFANQSKKDFAVLNFEDPEVRNFAKATKAQVVFFGVQNNAGVHFNRDFYFGRDKVFANQGLPIFGHHNLLNVSAAIAVAKILDIADENIEKGVRNFKSLPHRLEDLGFVQGVRYINNSMCTNEHAAVASFLAVEGPKIVIVGGKQKSDKGLKYLDLLAKDAKACVIFGENGPAITQYFKTRAFSNFSVAQDMDDAICKARAFAKPGDIILLNPGYASFDYFRNFEERGEAFKNAAQRH